MDNNKRKKINKNNRKRGGAFEKRVADYLGFEVVPYSGSNARFGYGDIRNDEWLIECKNITPNNNKITIKRLWIDKNRERADNINKKSCVAWMPTGRTDKFILMESIDFKYLGIIPDYTYNIIAKVHNTKNLIFDMSEHYIKDIRHGLVVEFLFNNKEYYMMSLDKYREMINIDDNRY